MSAPRPYQALSFALVLAGSSLVVTGCKKAEPVANAQEEPAISVTTAAVTSLQTPLRLRLTGSLQGERETELAANVTGRITKTDVERGQTIKQGDLLAEVDISAARLALAEAKVSVQTSETQEKINNAECERYEKMKAAGVVTDLEYDQVTAKCKTAPLNLEAARARQSIAAKNVGDGRIRAPFSGIITERFVEVGEYVQPSSRVVSLAQVNDLRVAFSVPEKNYPDVKIGAEVLVRVAAYEGQVFAGKVSHISGAVRQTRDVVVEASVPNAERKLLPGMFADVELWIGTTLLPSIPASALFDQNGNKNVYVAKDGRLQQRVVSVAPPLLDRIPVRDGLKEGELVVITLTSDLKNGAPIK
jgi:membrane fusion protein (multidrug efflux system)